MNFALPHTDRALLDAVRVSPIGRDLIAAEVKQTMAARRKLIAEIDALDAKAAAESPKHERAVAAAIDDVRAAEAALRVANDRLRDVGYAKSQWSLGYTLARQRLEQELRNGADGDAIDAFIRDMHDDQDLSRKAHVGGLDHQTNPVTRKASLRRYTNAKTVFARIEAAKAAIDEAERLRLSADQSAVRARLAELRAKLPAIGEAEYLPS